jgi:hypothetical protein
MFACSFSALGQEMILKLERLEKITDQEKKGDELFFSITEYPQKASPSHYQVPSFPTHWLSHHLEHVKDIVLWKKDVTQCQNVELFISLVEEDLEPWDLNDALGSVQLKIQCENGKMTSKWEITEKESTKKIENKDSEFTFSDGKALYKAVFKLENSKTSHQSK